MPTASPFRPEGATTLEGRRGGDRDGMNLIGSCIEAGFGRGFERRAGGEDVVDEPDARARRKGARAPKRAPDVLSPLLVAE